MQKVKFKSYGLNYWESSNLQVQIKLIFCLCQRNFAYFTFANSVQFGWNIQVIVYIKFIIYGKLVCMVFVWYTVSFMAAAIVFFQDQIRLLWQRYMCYDVMLFVIIAASFVLFSFQISSFWWRHLYCDVVKKTLFVTYFNIIHYDVIKAGLYLL